MAAISKKSGGRSSGPLIFTPEPRHGQWNSDQKDELEDVIHDLVCGHEMTLQQGQAVFLGDWRHGYRKYVQRR